MALQKPYETDSGIALPAAYFKVASVSGSKLGGVINVDVYADQAASVVGKRQLESKRYDFNDALDGRWDAKAYEHLKTLPEFSDAVDC